MQKHYQGPLSFSDLWAQHNEHRLFFPRLIMLTLAWVSGWNISYELVINILLAVGIFVAIVYQLQLTAKRSGGAKVHWILPTISLIVFSLSQWQNWLWGWQIQILLNVFAAAVGIQILSNSQSRASFSFALFLGIIATYSFANGILYWFIGLAILLTLLGYRSKGGWLKIGTWIAISALVIALYMYDYHKPENYPSLWIIFEEPAAYVQYVLVYIGAPAAVFNQQASYVLGVFGITTLVATVLLLMRCIPFNIIAPYIGWASYAVGTALLTGIGRVGFGVAQGRESRYITISSLIWVTVVILSYLILNTRSKQARLYHFCALLTIIIVTSGFGTNSVLHHQQFIRHHQLLVPARAAIISSGNPQLLRRIYPNIKLTKARIRTLRKHHLSVFRNDTAITSNPNPD